MVVNFFLLHQLTLCQFINQLKTPIPTNRNSHIPASATHVFVRHDAVRKPLQPPYDGPFRIIKRTDKHFTLDLNGRHDRVSIDRSPHRISILNKQYQYYYIHTNRR